MELARPYQQHNLNYFPGEFVLTVSRWISVFQFEPIVQKGNEGFVHHFLLYECEGNFAESYFDKGKDCFNVANMPYAKCRDASLVAAWAVGGEVIINKNKFVNVVRL